MEDEPANTALDHPRRVTRLAGAGAVAFSAIAWWPAFTLGAWGQVFIEQLLTLWAVATAAFVVVIFGAAPHVVRGWRGVTLLLPTLWVILAFLVSAVASGPSVTAVAFFGTIITLAGIPFMALVLTRIAMPDADEVTTARDRWAIITAVVVVVLAAFVLGKAQAHFLTCGDFTISGNSQPPGCTPGDATLDV